MKSTQKIIQITALMGPGDTSNTVVLYALCDDSTVWYLCPDDNRPKWREIHSIEDED